MLCHKRFVGCRHALSRFQTPFYKCIRRFYSTHYFHYDLNFRIINDHINVMNYLFLYRISRKISQIKNIFDTDFISCSLIDNILIFFEHFYNSRTDCAISQYRYTYHPILPFLSLFLFVTFHKTTISQNRLPITARMPVLYLHLNMR